LDGISSESIGIAPNLWLALDILGTFVFALSGGLLATRKQFDMVGIAVISVAAGLGGGMTRDLLAREVPLILRRDIYALAAGLGGVAVVGLLWIGAGTTIAGAGGLIATIGLRLLAIRYGWQASRA
jgi:uncharacterized membrane protein YeiH